MDDNEALEKRINADWLLVTERASSSEGVSSSRRTDGWLNGTEYKGVYIGDRSIVVGCQTGSERCQLVVDGFNVLEEHAKITRKNGKATLQDMGSEAGTWVNGKRVQANAAMQLHPGDTIEFGAHPAKEVYRVKLQHSRYRSERLCGAAYKSIGETSDLSSAVMA